MGCRARLDDLDSDIRENETEGELGKERNVKLYRSFLGNNSYGIEVK
jgi:hypothetical protein